MLELNGELGDESDPRGLFATTVEMLIQAAQKISLTIPKNDELATYMDKVEDISEVELSGKVENKGAADIIMRFVLLPGIETDDPFTGMSFQYTD